MGTRQFICQFMGWGGDRRKIDFRNGGHDYGDRGDWELNQELIIVCRHSQIEQRAARKRAYSDQGPLERKERV